MNYHSRNNSVLFSITSVKCHDLFIRSLLLSKWQFVYTRGCDSAYVCKQNGVLIVNTDFLGGTFPYA